MAQQSNRAEEITVSVENIGGITETTVQLTPGVTVLTGRNASNRTSFLQAVMAALGSDRATVKGDADEGHVEMTLRESTYTRELKRSNEEIMTSGDPYLDDPTMADLFAFLLESNEARQAVANGDDLREVIMFPVDTDEIERDIDRLRDRRDNIDKQISEIEEEKRTLPDRKVEKNEIKSGIEEKRSGLSDIEDKISNIDSGISEDKGKNEKLEAKFNELNEHQQELETVRQELDAQRESLRALEDEREEISSALEESQELSDDRLETIEADIQQLREKRDQIGSTVDELQTVIQFNENLLDGDPGVFGELHDQEGDVTDKLLENGDDIVCWTCGNDIDTSQVETMLENLRDLRNRHMDRRNELGSEIDDLTSERERIEEKQRQHERNKSRLRTVEDEIERRTARLEDLQAREETLSNELDDLEEELETLRADERPDSGLSELRKEASRLEVEIDRLESDLSSIEGEIDRIESRIDERDGLEEQREEVQRQIADLRMRIDRLEADSAEQFNDHMEAILDVLEYANLERIWIERTEKEVQRGRQTVTEGQFELHVVRNTESGAAYEDTVDHLSESEREVTGLVFALAGYLVHEVHDEVPFMLLDSVEAIDAPRLSSLVDYFSDYAENLVIALLEEDARALDESYQRVTNI